MSETSKPVLWLTRKLSDKTEQRAQASFEVILNVGDIPPSADEIISMSENVDAILPCHSEVFTREVVEQLNPRVRIVANHSVGTDHCDLEAFGSRGIVVTNTPDVLSDATAEIAMMLLLGAARRAAEGDRMLREGRWDSWSPSFMVGKQVTGKRLGIVGMGKVGQVVARRARGFDMEVHYFNRTRLDADREAGSIYHDNLDSLLGVSDFLSLHCPATDSTRNLINADNIAKMPRGSVLVNTSRGALVNESDFLDAIKSGHLAAAGLDCFQTEPGGNPAFAEHENIFMSPHIGSANFETRDAMGFRALDNLDAFFDGKEPGDRVA
ncbi:MAG: D-glycerate dehydrogenase [Pseudomonadota bacterium]